MAHTLITFLGKGSKKESGYRQADYCFESGVCRTTPYFGLALLKELAHGGKPVDHLVVLGTASSIWDALLIDEMRDSDLWMELSERVENSTVDDAILKRVADDITAHFTTANLARRVSLRIIPFARDNQEQIAILRLMADMVASGDQVSLDISHGFRTLPMLGLISALFLQQVKRAAILGIYYGALEMTQPGEPTPVVRLDGLLRIAHWLNAISAFRVSGDYGLFAPLVADQDAANSFQQAGFLEKTLNVTQARKHLQQAVAHFPEMSANDPVFALFTDELQNFTGWTEERTLAKRQLATARNALDTGNYMQAAALAVEACITHHLPPGADPNNFQDRETAKSYIPNLPAYKELKDLRNALAHGTRANRNTYNQQATLATPSNFEQRLSHLLEEIRKIIH